MIRIGLLLTFTLLLSCRTNKNINGYYAQKHFAYGFFKSFLTLNIDSTFKYQFTGDLIHDIGIGTFTIRNKNHLLLNYTTPEVDTLFFKDSTTKTIEYWADNKLRLKLDTVRFLNSKLRHNHFHKTFKIKNNGKIVSVDSNGNRFKRCRCYYSKLPRYFFWGSYYKKKKNPFIKIRDIK